MRVVDYDIKLLPPLHTFCAAGNGLYMLECAFYFFSRDTHSVAQCHCRENIFEVKQPRARCGKQFFFLLYKAHRAVVGGIGLGIGKCKWRVHFNCRL